MQKIDSIIIHCTDTYEDMDIGVTEIRQWHKRQGWRDIGYHFALRRDGIWEQGRMIDEDDFLTDFEQGAHALGYNDSSLGLAIVGGKDRKTGLNLVNYTVPQWKALEEFVEHLMDRYEIPLENVIGHRDVSDKWCPGIDITSWRTGL